MHFLKELMKSFFMFICYQILRGMFLDRLIQMVEVGFFKVLCEISKVKVRVLIGFLGFFGESILCLLIMVSISTLFINVFIIKIVLLFYKMSCSQSIVLNSHSLTSISYYIFKRKVFTACWAGHFYISPVVQTSLVEYVLCRTW
jgi:hypothetical protein